MTVVVATPPIDEPITLAQAKAHLRVDHEADDALIVRLITAARRHVEKLCDRALMPQTWRLTLPAWPSDDQPVRLPGGLVRSITSVQYLDPDGDLTTYTDYDSDLDSQPALIGPLSSWPATAARMNAARITYAVGYATAADVPADIIAAMLLIIGDLYANRESIVTGTIVANTMAVDALLWNYRRVEP